MQNGSSLPITASFVHLTEAEGSALRSHLGRLGCKLLGALRRRDGSFSIHREGTPRLRRCQPATLASSSASPLCSSRELEGANGRSSVARGEVKSVAWGSAGRWAHVGRCCQFAWGTRRGTIGGRAHQGRGGDGDGDGRGVARRVTAWLCVLGARCLRRGSDGDGSRHVRPRLVPVGRAV